MRRYHIQGRDDYKKYSKLCGNITQLVHFLKKLSPTDPVRIELTDQLLEKLAAVVACALFSLKQLSLVSSSWFTCYSSRICCCKPFFQETLACAGYMLLALSPRKRA